MEQVAYGVHAELDDKYYEDKEDDSDTGEDQKVMVLMTEMITRTQKKLEGNSDHYFIFKTDMTLIWNTTQTKEKK